MYAKARKSADAAKKIRSSPPSTTIVIQDDVKVRGYLGQPFGTSGLCGIGRRGGVLMGIRMSGIAAVSIVAMDRDQSFRELK